VIDLDTDTTKAATLSQDISLVNPLPDIDSDSKSSNQLAEKAVEIYSNQSINSTTSLVSESSLVPLTPNDPKE
jgi:hypothetical protein